MTLTRSTPPVYAYAPPSDKSRPSIDINAPIIWNDLRVLFTETDIGLRAIKSPDNTTAVVRGERLIGRPAHTAALMYARIFTHKQSESVICFVQLVGRGQCTFPDFGVSGVLRSDWGLIQSPTFALERGVGVLTEITGEDGALSETRHRVHRPHFRKAIGLWLVLPTPEKLTNNRIPRLHQQPSRFATRSDSHMADVPSTAPSVHPRKVLLLVDVQVNMLAQHGGGVPNASTVGANIERILRLARSAPHPPLIVHVRNTGESGDPDAPGTPGWQLVHPPRAGEPVIDKTKNNAFAGTRLAELVDRKAALVVVGMQSDFCIRATCSAALGRGNTVFLVEDAHATYDRPEAYSASGPVLITPAHKVEKEIESELEEAGVFVVKVEDLPHIFDEDS
ncbi:Isochorismatase hydrolase [Fomitiporia mediterranea MF3/22]|uniref:Isochorismatase hydrolase n=1 Tax=Fomitiporia mediterranea (strain MF3/22) TaxID=694068 RepID=UPI0004408D55|nr:Isochorismatase hydrolase [Fomitiporia mediterranea MF3/22]EJD06813.1 Isochorismatase hydrolase [Fomitiporia mediterranea MF3/22]